MRSATDRTAKMGKLRVPHFVRDGDPESIRRFVWRDSERLAATPIYSESEACDLEKTNTAMRPLDARELVFARSVILVEEDTTLGFLREVAPKLEVDLNGEGISIVSVDGDTGFSHFYPILEKLKIPFVAFRDPPWPATETRETFFSFGIHSFEVFMDAEGFE